MISLESARDRILAALLPLGHESVPVSTALRRVTATGLVAPGDLPSFDNSAVDGYAVRSVDLAAAGPEAPVRLRLSGCVAAGSAPTGEVQAGACFRIFTGAMLPPGTDAVVMQEDTAAQPDGTIEIRATTTPWENVRFAGEDVRRGTTVVAPGVRLRPAHLGLLTSLGFASIDVHRQPRYALITTGNELLEPGEPPAPGRLPDSNRVLLQAVAQAAGFRIGRTGRAADDLGATVAAIADAARDHDVVITTGGVSVGDADFVKAAVEALGGSIEFWKIAARPGKPFAWGRIGDACWFGLPGNPVSAFVTWHLLVRPAMRRLEGESDVRARQIPATLAEGVANRGDRRHFVRVALDDHGMVRSVGPQASHIQSGLAAADALLDVPPETSWEAGRRVLVELLD